MQTDLPLPVAPAISKCGILSTEVTIHFPEISFPKAIGINDFSFTKLSDIRISFNITEFLTSFSTSIPTTDLPGIGACILIPLVASESDKSSARLTILETFTPGLGSNS